jgi:hypothetical protein
MAIRKTREDLLKSIAVLKLPDCPLGYSEFRNWQREFEQALVTCELKCILDFSEKEHFLQEFMKLCSCGFLKEMKNLDDDAFKVFLEKLYDENYLFDGLRVETSFKAGSNDKEQQTFSVRKQDEIRKDISTILHCFRDKTAVMWQVLFNVLKKSHNDVLTMSENDPKVAYGKLLKKLNFDGKESKMVSQLKKELGSLKMKDSGNLCQNLNDFVSKVNDLTARINLLRPDKFSEEDKVDKIIEDLPEGSELKRRTQGYIDALDETPDLTTLLSKLNMFVTEAEAGKRNSGEIYQSQTIEQSTAANTVQNSKPFGAKNKNKNKNVNFKITPDQVGQRNPNYQGNNYDPNYQSKWKQNKNQNYQNSGQRKNSNGNYPPRNQNNSWNNGNNSNGYQENRNYNNRNNYQQQNQNSRQQQFQNNRNSNQNRQNNNGNGNTRANTIMDMITGCNMVGDDDLNHQN